MCGMSQEVNSVRRNGGAAMQDDVTRIENEEFLPRNLGCWDVYNFSQIGGDDGIH